MESIVFNTIQTTEFSKTVVLSESVNFELIGDLSSSTARELFSSITFDTIQVIEILPSQYTTYINTTDGRTFIVTRENRVYEVYLPERDKSIY